MLMDIEMAAGQCDKFDLGMIVVPNQLKWVSSEMKERKKDNVHYPSFFLGFPPTKQT